ncbi:MAG: PEP-CTERM sorting domain-containing protein [Burkholderiaceae bacterium]|nr:PEP-CTERM sorting domain-containing protein [Burkholderiaceae bacterium]
MPSITLTPLRATLSNLHRLLRPVALATGLLCSSLLPAQAIDLLRGFGDDGVYGALALQPNDDESSSLLDLPFSVNFFGNTYSSFYVNNNGNITFGNPLGDYTPQAFPRVSEVPTPMIAAWWADVDTRVGDIGGGDPLPTLMARRNLADLSPYAGANNVYVGAPNANTVVITWDQVGYYSQHNDKTNSFQIVLRNRADTGVGNFDIDFRYSQLQWTTGDASDGVNGLGGTPASAGYDAGDGVNFLTLPGSRTEAVLNLVNTSNVDGSNAGLWSFAVRNGDTPGSSPSNPLMPVLVEAGYSFDFNVQANTVYFIDPLVAVGYDYQLSAADGQSFASVVVSTLAGDGIYALSIWNGSAFVLVDDQLSVNETYMFNGTVTRFLIDRIEVEAGLDPANPLAFVTGVSFTQTGAVNVLQTPITVSVPEPATNALLLGGLLALGWAARRRR